MRFALLIVLLWVSTGYRGKHHSGIDTKQTVTPEEIEEIIDRHNYWRSEVGIGPLEWSDELAGIAEKWAKALKKDGCAFYHSDYGFGENLWKGTTGHYSAGDAIDAWASEKEDYSYRKNKCKAGKVCGHYTQIVWESSKKVGCAKITCDGYTTWVCEYDPPGNWVGQKPY